MDFDRDLSVCCVKGCDRPSEALGLCVNHWRRNRKYGSPVALKTHSGQFRGLSAQERFAKQVIKREGCWGWRASRDHDGYPIFRGEFDGVRYTKAHRFSYALHTGEHPGPRHVMHSCDNPRCTNPDHLSLGTNADNMADKIAKGRARVCRGEEAGHAKITRAQAEAIKADARAYVVIAAEHGIAPSTVGSIKNGESWRHVETPVQKAKRVSPRKGVSDKLGEQAVRDIRSSTERGKVLADRYGVSAQTICDIQKRRSWAHVT
jgi:hypothetical protein